MRKRSALFLLTASCLFLLVTSAVPAGPKGQDRPLPHRFGSLDGGLVQVDNPADGRQWAAWSYRDGDEFAVAVASANASGLWTEPTLIGLDDGVDQIDPALSVDRAGRIYLVYTERESHRILARYLDPVTGIWSDAGIVAVARGAASPTVRVVGDRVVVGYRVGRQVHVVDFAQPGATSIGTHDIVDGPDPFGGKDDDAPEEDDEDGGDPPEPITGIGDPDSTVDVQPLAQGSNPRSH